MCWSEHDIGIRPLVLCSPLLSIAARISTWSNSLKTFQISRNALTKPVEPVGAYRGTRVCKPGTCVLLNLLTYCPFQIIFMLPRRYRNVKMPATSELLCSPPPTTPSVACLITFGVKVWGGGRNKEGLNKR
jgi:hypothetical protein